MSSKKNTKVTGAIGEDVAKQFLIQRGYSILEMNYWRKWGEIDIVAKKGDKVHFVEVKTVSHETKQDLKWAVSRGTWRPEELVHRFKLHQIHKALQTWISDNKYAGDFQIDVMAVRIVPHETFATVKLIENIIEAS
jgi:putative endonuclease